MYLDFRRRSKQTACAVVDRMKQQQQQLQLLLPLDFVDFALRLSLTFFEQNRPTNRFAFAAARSQLVSWSS